MLIEIDRQPARWTITLNRPEKANALTAEMIEALIAIVAEAREACIPVLVFRGNGRNFSAGFDFTDFDQQSEGDLIHRFVRIEMLLQAVARSPCLTVAFAHGRNFGAGADLFAVCRWRIASADASFRMPGIAFGLILGTRRFASLVGRENARDILEGLKTFDAQRAKDMGFARTIAEAGHWPALIAEAQGCADALAAEHRARLYSTLHSNDDDRDLADLVRSAAIPGLKDRIRGYLG